MDIVTFKTFLAAASTGSFAAAAQRIHASPSSVTERIKQLEHQLGAQLFIRDKRGCRLTPAGEKFMAPALQATRAWDLARHEVKLPERFSRSLSLGGQYFFWDRGFMDWLAELRGAMPDLALRVTAGASARLNRDLAEGFLDMAIIYDPIFHRDIRAEPLYSDELVLVTGGEPDNWRKDFVRIEWGQALGLEIASRIDLAPETGLSLDLGMRSADWLASQRMSGYLPLRAAKPYIASGALALVDDAPRFDFPAYVCWRRSYDGETCEEILKIIRGSFEDTLANG